MQIVPATQYHLSQMQQLVFKEWGEKYSEMMKHEFLAQSDYTPLLPQFFVAIKNDEVIGMISSIQAQFCDSVWTLSWLIVNQKFRKQGIATQLLQYAIEHVKQQAQQQGESSILLLLSTSEDLREFYETLGWKLLKTYSSRNDKLFAKEIGI